MTSKADFLGALFSGFMHMTSVPLFLHAIFDLRLACLSFDFCQCFNFFCQRSELLTIHSVMHKVSSLFSNQQAGFSQYF